MPRIIAVSSAKGGVGKSTTTINLGAALAQENHDVTIVDANLHTPSIGLHLGSYEVPITLNHVLLGKHHISEAVYRHKSGMKVIPASLAAKNRVPLANLRQHLQQLETTTVILDGSPGLHADAAEALRAADDILVVTHPDLPSLAEALRTVQWSRSLHKRILGIVVTRTGHPADLSRQNIQAILKEPVIANIPEDQAFRHALRQRQPVVDAFPKSKAAHAYRHLSSFITGKTPAQEGFWSRFFS